MPTDDEDLLYYQGSGSGDLEAEEREDIVEEYDSTGCRGFKRGVQNCLRINMLQGNYILNFENWCSGWVCQKVTKFDFESQFSKSKIVRVVLILYPA